MSTCNRLDLETLGSQPVMPNDLPAHWSLRIQEYCCRGSLFRYKIMVFFLYSLCTHVMLTFAEIHLYPMWKLHSSTCKVGIGELRAL